MTGIAEIRTADGLRLPVDDAGDGPVVVLVHGLGLSRANWQVHTAGLRQAGFRTICYDQRGFGDADAPSGPYPMSQLAADLELLLVQVDAPVHLVGHSLGGMVCQTVAVNNPDRIKSLTLVGTSAHIGERASKYAEGIAKLAEFGFDNAVADTALKEEIEGYLAIGFPFGPPPIEIFRKGLEEPNPSHAHAWRTMIGFSIKDGIKAFARPVLVAHGELDNWIPYGCGQWLANHVPGARWHSFPQTGHFPHLKYKQEFGELLLDFLQSGERP